MLQKSMFYGYWLDVKLEEMNRPWNTPVIKSLMWILPCSCFLLEAGTKKTPCSEHTPVYLFSNKTTRCTSIDLWGRNGISQDGRTDFKDRSKERWNCCKLSLKDYCEDCSIFTPNCHQSQNVIFSEGVLIASESWNGFNLYSRLVQSFFGKIPSNHNRHGIGNWKKKVINCLVF